MSKLARIRAWWAKHSGAIRLAAFGACLAAVTIGGGIEALFGVLGSIAFGGVLAFLIWGPPGQTKAIWD